MCIRDRQNDVFETNQIELLFSPMSLGKEKLLQIIQKREDYTYYHGIHQLLNPITEEKISIVMNEYEDVYKRQLLSYINIMNC